MLVVGLPFWPWSLRVTVGLKQWQRRHGPERELMIQGWRRFGRVGFELIRCASRRRAPGTSAGEGIWMARWKLGMLRVQGVGCWIPMWHSALCQVTPRKLHELHDAKSLSDAYLSLANRNSLIQLTGNLSNWLADHPMAPNNRAFWPRFRQPHRGPGDV